MSAADELANVSPVDKSREKHLERLLSEANDRIDALSRERWTIPLSKSGPREGAFIRVIVPDTHGSHLNKEAANAFLHDLDSLGAREVVWLGDHIDCGGFLAQHHVWGYVAEADYSFADDIDAANVLLDAVQERTPDAEHHFLLGNHERRLETWCMTETLRHQKDAQFLLDLVGPRSVLNIDKRGFQLYEQGKRYGDCKIPATIKLGKCHFTHGQRSGKHATSATLGDFGGCVVHGHTHRRACATTWTVNEGEIAAWCPGFLAEIQPYWTHQRPTGWTHGYAIQLVQADGRFLHVNVPIIDGVSYLVQMTERIRA